MFAYIFSHFFNHALGNISYDLMETWLKYHVWWWRIPIVNDTLYLAAIVHFSLGLWALYQRRHFRYSTAEITQLVLGLSIPLWLASHLGAERVGGALFGWPPFNYASALYTYWVTERYNIAVQFISLTVAWTHACIGLYFWLRLKSFFDWAAPILLSIAILYAAARHDWRASWWSRGRGARRRSGVAQRKPEAGSSCAGATDHANQSRLFSDRLWRCDRVGFRIAWPSFASRAQARHGHNFISKPAGACTKRS